MEIISSAFKNNEQDICEQIIECLYSSYRTQFVTWAKIAYPYYDNHAIEFTANNSFTDGVLKFQEAAGKGALYQSNASVKTVLFHYCRYKLLAHLKDEERLIQKNRKLSFHLQNENSCNIVETETEMQEKRHVFIMQALKKMSAADRQIIQWRHIEEKSNDEIAVLLAIKVESATNRIYRCMQRLRKLIEEMGKNDEP